MSLPNLMCFSALLTVSRVQLSYFQGHPRSLWFPTWHRKIASIIPSNGRNLWWALQLITVPKARIENFRFRRFSIPAKELFISRSVLLWLTWNQARSSGIIHPQLVIEPYLQKYYLFDRLHNPTSNAGFLSTALRSCPKGVDFCEKPPAHVWKIVIESEISLWPAKTSPMQ